jgi:restriction system protein
MGDLSAISVSYDAFKETYIVAYPDTQKGSIGTSSGMLYRFVHEVQKGNYVVFPSKIDRKINIGSLRAPISMMMQQRCIQIAGR